MLWIGLVGKGDAEEIRWNDDVGKGGLEMGNGCAERWEKDVEKEGLEREEKKMKEKERKGWVQER